MVGCCYSVVCVMLCGHMPLVYIRLFDFLLYVSMSGWVVVVVLFVLLCVVLCRFVRFVSRLHSFVRCIVVLVVDAFMLFCYFVVCVSVCVVVSTSA